MFVLTDVSDFCQKDIGPEVSYRSEFTAVSPCGSTARSLTFRLPGS